MTLIGYTMMCEQTGLKQLMRDVAFAEQVGFDFAVISEYYFNGACGRWISSPGSRAAGE